MHFKSALAAMLLLLLSVATGFAQDKKNKEFLKKQFAEYMTTFDTKDFNKSMTYLPDEFFQVIPREQMIAVMEQVFNSPEMEVGVKGGDITEVGDMVKIDNKYYTTFSYTQSMTMKFKDADEDKTAEEKLKRLQMIKALFGQEYGAENVQLNETTEVFAIAAEKKACAILKEGQTDWKFLVLEEKQKPMLEKMLPAQFLKTL